ncbi:MAG: SUKH-4 family immunity protein [Bacteroidota bacterium]
MSPQEFQKVWLGTDDPLSPISQSHLDKFNLQKRTYEFLKIAGFPKNCEPNLAFVGDTDDIVYGMNKLTEQYDFEGDNPNYEKYIVIGSCRDGDAIAIDTSENDKIVELDHEGLFSSSYFNSSIETLADFLILYRDFETDVIGIEDPQDSRQYYSFTDEQLERLKSKMFAIDNKAITEEGFWKSQLEIMLSIRQEEFPQ